MKKDHKFYQSKYFNSINTYQNLPTNIYIPFNQIKVIKSNRQRKHIVNNIGSNFHSKLKTLRNDSNEKQMRRSTPKTHFSKRKFKFEKKAESRRKINVSLN